MVNSEIVKTTGKPVDTISSSGLRSDNEASSRPATVNCGGFYTPDTRRLGYGSDGVSAPGGSGPVSRGGGVSQAGRGRR